MGLFSGKRRASGWLVALLAVASAGNGFAAVMTTRVLVHEGPGYTHFRIAAFCLAATMFNCAWAAFLAYRLRHPKGHNRHA